MIVVFTLFFSFSSPPPAPPLPHTRLFFLPLLPAHLLPFLLSRSLLFLVVVLVQRRWQAARWSPLHRVARQGLSHPKRKAGEQRLRVTNLLEPEAGLNGRALRQSWA